MVFVRITRASGDVNFTVNHLYQARLVLADIYNVPTSSDVLKIEPGDTYTIKGENLVGLLTGDKEQMDAINVQILNLD